jgi:hypothetical protein
MVKPSRKWFVTQITAVTALVTMLLTTGSWDLEESLGLVGLISQALIAYVVPNTATDLSNQEPA